MNKSAKPRTKGGKLDLPLFASEEEERIFWETHDSTEYLDWSQARQLTLPNLKPTTKTISLRLPKHLLDEIRSAANSRDVSYQSLIKVWLEEKLHGH
jgi:predicted DNA binding CopG/RHH family protein